MDYRQAALTCALVATLLVPGVASASRAPKDDPIAGGGGASGVIGIRRGTFRNTYAVCESRAGFCQALKASKAYAKGLDGKIVSRPYRIGRYYWTTIEFNK